MIISKKYFNNCTLYILLWVIYSLQGTLYASGGIISRGLLVVLMLMSIYYAIKVNNSGQRLPSFLRVLNVFVAMITLYGVVAILDPTPLIVTGDGLYAPIAKFEFLKTAYISLFPIYVFYYFAKKGILTEETIRFISIILLINTTVSFVEAQNSMLADAMAMRSSREEFTNNVAYTFLQLMPLAFFWRRKPIMQDLDGMYIVAFLVMGMKRGALLIGAVCLIWFIYSSWRSARGTQKVIIAALTAIMVAVGIHYIAEFYATSDYFQQRLERTMAGDSSGRDEIYSTLWNHYLNETSFLRVLFGNGAMQTINIAGNYAHNDWLEVLTCHGALGIFIYLMYFVSLVRCWISSRKSETIYGVLGMVLLIMFASTLFSMSYNSLSIGITLCLGYCLSQGSCKNIKVYE